MKHLWAWILGGVVFIGGAIYLVWMKAQQANPDSIYYKSSSAGTSTSTNVSVDVPGLGSVNIFGNLP